MTPEQNIFAASIRRFVNDEILPHYETWEKAEIFPRMLWNRLGEEGLLCVDIPEEYGGAGADFTFSMLIQEIFNKANCPTVGGAMMVHSDIVAHYILNHGTAGQRAQYLPAMVRGECVGAVAMSEPGAGSDLQAIRTSARKEGSDYIINGSKIFISNGQHCDLIVVAARTDLSVRGSKGTTLFLVDASTPGFKRGRNLEKIGLHSGDTSELFFDDVRVSASAILGDLNRGFAILMGELQRERLALAISAVSAAEGVLEETVRYVKDRRVFGAPLSDMQNTRFKLAEVATDVRVHRAFVEECKTLFIGGELDEATVSMAKVACTEMQGRVVDACLQLHGGYGFMREYGVSRAFVDARVQRIYGGTSEIMKELISRHILA